MLPDNLIKVLTFGRSLEQGVIDGFGDMEVLVEGPIVKFDLKKFTVGVVGHGSYQR